MVQFIQRGPSFGEQLGQSVGGALSKFSDMMTQLGLEKAKTQQKFDLMQQILQQTNKKRGSDLSGSSEGKTMGNNETAPEGEFDFYNLPPEAQGQFAELSPAAARAMQESSKEKRKEKRFETESLERKIQAGLKDTSKLRTDLANKSSHAQKAILNKEHLTNLIEKGNIDNPLLVSLADRLPKGFRESLLSNDSLLYESGLFEEFGVLRDMFPGQIRVAELQILEPKLASLYKNDEAKKAILQQGIKALKADIIRGKAASDVEKEHAEYTVARFNEEVEKRAAPGLERLYNSIQNNLTKIAEKYSPKTVTMRDPQGNFYDKIPIEMLSKAREQGLTLVE
jgi:hypothetical protein